jgi:putative membrane protein
MTEKTEIFEKYNNRTHVLGRIVCTITLVMLLGAPFVMGMHLGAMPNLPAAGKAFLAVGVVWFVSCIAEYLVYTPMLGAGGGYLAFITGNLINMKIPCAVNARDIVGAKTGTPENEIISTLSIATASLVTILVLALGVALLIPLQPVLQDPALQPAFDNVVPALFGAMAYKYFRNNLKIALIPLAVMSLLFIFVPGLISSTSFMILPSGAIAIGIAFLLYRKNKQEA